MPTPPIPQLPQDRVGDHPPFAVTGVDFAGPMYTTTPLKFNDTWWTKG